MESFISAEKFKSSGIFFSLLIVIQQKPSCNYHRRILTIPTKQCVWVCARECVWVCARECVWVCATECDRVRVFAREWKKGRGRYFQLFSSTKEAFHDSFWSSWPISELVNKWIKIKSSFTVTDLYCHCRRISTGFLCLAVRLCVKEDERECMRVRVCACVCVCVRVCVRVFFYLYFRVWERLW